MAHGTEDWWSRTRALMDLDFKDLTDTPGSYAGKAGTVPEVTALEDGLEFSDAVIDNHHARHENGGADEISVVDLSGVLNDEQKSSWAQVSGKPTTFVKSTNVITDHRLVRGDGGARNVQETTIIVDDSGRMTNPGQPAFQVVPSVAQSNIAVGVAVTIVWGTERFDVGGNFASNVFTAPVTGKYMFSVCLGLEKIDIDATYYQLALVTSNKSYYSTLFPRLTADIRFSLPLSVLADMDAADTAYATITQGGGVQQTNIAPITTFFSGVLIC